MKLAPLLNEITNKYANQVDIIYKSPELVVLAPKNSNIAAKFSHGTEWCSQRSSGFCMHRLNEVLFRFLFKDGYKARLNVRNGGNVGHWGGQPAEGNRYPVIQFSRNIKNIPKGYEGMDDLVKHIMSIPDEVSKIVYDYTVKNSLEILDITKKTLYQIDELEDRYPNLRIYTWPTYDENTHRKTVNLFVRRDSQEIGKFEIDDKGNIINLKSTNKKIIPLYKLKYWLGQQDKMTELEKRKTA